MSRCRPFPWIGETTMNNEQARPTSRQTPGADSVREDYRKCIARKRRQRRKQRRLILCAAVLLALVLLIVLLVKGCFGSDPLTGTWDYDSNTTYQFDGKGSGAMILTSATYDFSYQVKGNQLFIDFSNEAARDCTYTFSVNDNTLTLTGGEGTIGGTYELHRQEE